MNEERAGLIEHILDLMEKLYHTVTPTVPREWLTLELTMPQVRILLLLFTQGPTRMGALASAAGITLSTATGTVDRLMDRGLVLREGEPQDRRLVICRLSSEGQGLASKLWEMGRLHIKGSLEPLTLDQLRTVAQAIEILHAAAGARTEDNRRDV